jgi:hypothetical protein
MSADVALIFGIFVLLCKSKYLAMQDPAPLATGGRILRCQMLAFYDPNNVKIQYSKVGQEKAYSICLVIQLSKTNPTGQERIVIHCHQPENSGICIVTMMETWIAISRDLYHLIKFDTVWQIPGFLTLNGDTR